jgi:cytochrome c-type biogenesis protein CcmH
MKFLLLFLLTLTSAYALTPDERYARYLEETRCMVCENQNLANSNTRFAQDLRLNIHTLIANGQPDAVIDATLKANYGESIFLRPHFTPRTWLLYAFPGLAFLTFLGWLIKRREPSLNLSTR